MPDFIDYSMYKQWNFCKWSYYERYVLRRQKKWPATMRDDALAIGSLVHSGLEGWYKNGTIEIPRDVIEKLNPTPETLRLTQGLVFGYVQTYPKEQWEFIRCEAPIRFNLISGRNGLAKIDMYFYIPERTTIESGVAGYEITLNPGWWIQEYKTKSPHVDQAEWMRSWTTNMQADFQMLALREFIYANNHLPGEHDKVNGLLINIIEKPKDYIPKRKCPECEVYWNYSAWQPQSGGMFKCPNGHEKKLKPLDTQKDAPQARYFRMMVERTPEQLECAKEQIKHIAFEMQALEDSHNKAGGNILLGEIGGFYPPNREHCLNLGARYARECEYFRPHTYGSSTIGNEEYQDTEDYIGETSLVG